jgi:hypothetical protein
MKKIYGSFIRGCSKRVYKKYFGSRIDVDGYGYSFGDYDKLIKEFRLISGGDLIYNGYNNIFEPVKEVRFRWVKMKHRYGKNSKHFPNIRFLDIDIISDSGYCIYDFDYRLINDHDDFKKAEIPNTTLKVWY